MCHRRYWYCTQKSWASAPGTLRHSLTATTRSQHDQVLLSPVTQPRKSCAFPRGSRSCVRTHPVDTRKGEQHDPAFLKINPNAKTPALVDGDTVVFDSNAILLYLAEKSRKFLPADNLKARGEMYSWLMFIATGIGPYSGQAVHFKHFAPDPKDYAVTRYTFEAWRHWTIINDRLANMPYMLGNEYTLVDMAVWGWARAVPFILGDEAWGNFQTSNGSLMKSMRDRQPSELKH